MRVLRLVAVNGNQQTDAPNVLDFQQSLELARGVIPPDGAEKFRARVEGREIARHVGRAPGIKLSRSKSTTGTGASGEIRATLPQMNWSSITSPITRMRVLVAAERTSRTRPCVSDLLMCRGG